MQAALEELWSFHGQLFASPPDYDRLVDQSLMPDLDRLGGLWQERVRGGTNPGRTLRVPDQETFSFGRYHHSYDFPELIKELQLVARLEEEARW